MLGKYALIYDATGVVGLAIFLAMLGYGLASGMLAVTIGAAAMCAFNLYVYGHIGRVIGERPNDDE